MDTNPDEKVSFWKSPMGIIVIILLSIVGLTLLLSLFSGKDKPINHRRNWSNNNYHKHGLVSPSLAGYI
jgi:hypothetical protein